MKKLRVLLAGAIMASAFVVTSASPAHANCVGEPINPCVLLCSVGLSNKYTAPAFRWCYVV